MFNFFSSKSTDKSALKGFKIAKNSERSKKYGIAANSLKALKEKIAAKLKINKFDLFLSDGILLEDEFFETVPDQSVIVIVEEDFDLILQTVRTINHDLFHARDLIKEYLSKNRVGDVFEAINHLQSKVDEKILSTSRDEDSAWFEGFEAKLSTKEEVMRRKSQDRIKGYFYKTKDELTKSRIYQTNSKARAVIEELLSDFFLFLNGVGYFSCFFDRSHEPRFKVEKVKDETDAKPITKPKRRRIDSETKIKLGESNLFKKFQVALCNESGYFNCHGSWKSSSCSYEHVINPYASRESLILFSIFNLDHQIEISRSIFPSILKSVEMLLENENCKMHGNKALSLSVLTYFEEIFTMKNLKLVHIVCHDKSSHEDLKSNGKIVCSECQEYKTIQKIKLKLS